MTVTTGPPTAERPDEDPEPWQPSDDGDLWPDPVTAPLTVYTERDLAFAPVAVRRERGMGTTAPAASRRRAPESRWRRIRDSNP